VKLSEMRERSVEELIQEIINTSKELFEYRINKHLYKLENTSLISKARNKVAQLKTIIREKQLQRK